MSMETHVFFRGTLPSKAAVSREMKELGLPFSIAPATGSLETQNGFMPMRRRGEETGVEFSVYADHFAVEEFADVGVDPSFERRASLRWGGDLQEAVAGMSVAAALAKLANGVVFDEAEGRLLSADDAVAIALQNLQALLKPEDKKRRGTGPADLKHYLKPLLKQRSDLVLVGRLLIIRPVRHLLRGALFGRSGDKYRFNVWRFLRPLFPVEDGNLFFHAELREDWTVWQPHFQALVFDSLAEDVFDAVGRITSLAHFRGDLGNGDYGFRARFEASVTALVLAGERERAAELIDLTLAGAEEDSYLHYLAGKQRALLERDLASLCAEFRSKEAEEAKALNLGDVWEPTPFPAEVPEPERAQRCDDPPFITTPWIPRPPRLVEAPPDLVSEVRFARGVLRRRDGVMMLVALTREEAEELHRTRQDYALATRLSDGHLLVLRHHTRWSPHDPDQPTNPNFVPSRSFYLEVHGPRERLLQGHFDEDLHQVGLMRMWSVDVYEPRTQHNVWSALNEVERRTKIIRDHRIDPLGYEERLMTDSDIELCQFQEPRFGDFDALWQRLQTYLHNEGFGTLRENFEC
jgi:hypothetical protein